MLLDEAGSAKVADFGTVREGAGDGRSHISTKSAPGTQGYVRTSTDPPPLVAPTTRNIALPTRS